MPKSKHTIDDGEWFRPRFSVVCTFCKHWSRTGFTCAAFPEDIPAEIWDGDNDHTKPFEGDNGIQFEPIRKG